MRYIGLDVHKNNTTACIIANNGKQDDMDDAPILRASLNGFVANYLFSIGWR